MINLELNITLKCNLSCAGCNRMCNVYKNRTEHMSIEQIQKFIDQARVNGGVNKLKVIGGEPLLHPQFVEIYNMLAEAGKEKIIKFIVIESNKTVPFPKVESYPFICLRGTVQRKKKHQPFLWSPKDLGFTYGANYKCMQLRKCGYSLDKYGYLPCSLAIMLSRLFGHTDLYRKEFPTNPWGLEKLCENCVFCMPQDWRNKFSSKGIFNFTEEENGPTKSFKDAMDKWNQEEFYKNQKEF